VTCLLELVLPDAAANDRRRALESGGYDEAIVELERGSGGHGYHVADLPVQRAQVTDWRAV
jgi:hypothetical protein